jgi:hypothetical protein
VTVVARPLAPWEIIRDRLSLYLGPNTARTAVKTFSHKSAGVPPEALSSEQVKLLLDALRPMLKTLLGAAQCDRILTQLTVEIDLRK